MHATIRFMPKDGEAKQTTWRGRVFQEGQAITVRDPRLVSEAEETGFVVEKTREERQASLLSLKGKETSAGVASIAAKRMRDPDPDVRRLAASALSQKAKR